MEVEHFLLSKIALQVLSDADRAYSHRCTRKQQITDFQGHEAADISNDFIYPEQHVRCMTALHLLIINRQMEVQPRASSSISTSKKFDTILSLTKDSPIFIMKEGFTRV